MLAAARPRRARASRAPRAAKPPPRRRRRALADLGAAQQRHRRPARRPPGRPGRGGGDDRRDHEQRPGQRHHERPARRLLVERLEQVAGGAAHRERADRDPERARHGARPRRAPRVLGGDPPAREPDRALDADGGQPALDVGRGRRRQHRRRGAQGDEREGDEQRDDDPRGRVDEHAHAAAGDEAHAADLGAGGARLLQEHVDPAGVGGPDERLVDRQALLGLGFDPPPRDVDPRRRGQREGHVVGRHGDPGHPQAAQPPDADLVADLQMPRVGHPALDDRLVAPPVDVAPGDDRVAAAVAVDQRDARLLRRPALRAQPDAGELQPVGAVGHVGQRAHDGVDLRARLAAEAHDDVGQVGLARRAVEARGQPVGDGHRGARHRRGEQDAANASRPRLTAPGARRPGAGRGRRRSWPRRRG